MRSLINNSSDNSILGYPIIGQPQNNYVLVYQNGIFIFVPLGGGGGAITSIANVGLGQQLFRDITSGVANFRTLAGSSDFVLTTSSNQVNFDLNTILGNIQQINSASGFTEINTIKTSNIYKNLDMVNINRGIYISGFYPDVSANFFIQNNLPDANFVIDGTNITSFNFISNSVNSLKIQNNTLYFSPPTNTITHLLGLSGTEVRKAALTDFITGGTNLATPNNVFKQKTGSNLEFRNLTSSGLVALTESANSIDIGVSAINNVLSAGGNSLISSLSLPTLNLKGLTSSNGINITSGVNTLDISNSLNPQNIAFDANTFLFGLNTTLVQWRIFGNITAPFYNIGIECGNSATAGFSMKWEIYEVQGFTGGNWLTIRESYKSITQLPNTLYLEVRTTSQLLEFKMKMIGGDAVNSYTPVVRVINKGNSGTVNLGFGASGGFEALAPYYNSCVNNVLLSQNVKDVVITAPVNGEVITYNGTNWINSATPATTTIYNGDGTLSANRTVNLGSRLLNFTNGGEVRFSYLTANRTTGHDRCLTMGPLGEIGPNIYVGNQANAKGFLTSVLSITGDYEYFYQATYNANASINLLVFANIRGQNDASVLSWRVKAMITDSGLFVCKPDLGNRPSQNNYYNLEINCLGNTFQLRIRKRYHSGTPPLAFMYYQVINLTDGGPTYSLMGATGNDLSFNQSYLYDSIESSFQGTGIPPSMVFNYTAGMDLFISLFVAVRKNGDNNFPTCEVRLGGSVVYTITTRVYGGGNDQTINFVASQKKLNVLNLQSLGILLPNTNTLILTFTGNVLVDVNSAYSVQVFQNL